MDSVVGRVADRRDVGRPRAAVILVGVLVALVCVGFAGVNVAFVMGGHVSGDGYARLVAGHSSGFTVMNWLVVVLKVIGAAVALASVTGWHRVRATVVGVAVWGAFSTLAVYVLGSLAEAAGFVLSGRTELITVASAGYVVFFLLFAAGFGVLAVSYARRHRLGRRHVLLGLLGAPVVLGLVLFAAPALLVASGMLPTG